MPRRVTLKKVAAHASVSYQTVSKVINHKAHVSDETQQRIWDAVRELGYTPSYTARSLRSQRSKTRAWKSLGEWLYREFQWQAPR